VYKPEYPGLYYFDTFTFTTLGTSGHRGPDPTKGYANAPWNPDQFSIVDGQQQWTVPATGTYRIEAAGAYGAAPGRVVSGDIDLSEGQTLTMLVGQQPTPLVANVADNVTVGGGGGTFVVSDGKPLIVASGGDGGSYSTGYISRDISVPNIVQPYVSMSGDATRFVSLDFDIITNFAQVSIYKYVSSQWIPETSFSFNGFNVKISGDGKTMVNVTFSSSIYVYRYITQWDLETILQVPNSVGYVDLSYDGSKLVSIDTLGPQAQASAYVFYRTGQTWSAPVLFSSGVWSNEAGVAISGDGNTLCMCSSGSIPPAIYDGSGVLSGYLPSYQTNECPTTITTSYDGSVIAAHTTPLHVVPPTGFVRVFVNLVLSYQITFEPADYSSKYIQLSYDGTQLLLGDNSYVRLYTDGTTYTTISSDVSSIDIASASMNSDASVIINAGVSLSAPTTTAYYKGTGSVPGSFIPSGAGNGVSGSGFYGDGQETDPFFGFLKPKAYVNGGFGNSYEYGQPGISKEGGFGGGQSPLDLLTGLTSIIGYKQVRPSIPLLSGQTVCSMALSEDGNTFLVSYIPYGYVGEGVNVYSYVDSSWVSSQLYVDNSTWKPAVSMSVDGSVWLIGSNVWRNGSFETTLPGEIQYGPGNYYPQQIRTSTVSGDGYICAVCGDMSCNVYVYSGASWSVLGSFPHGMGMSGISYTCALSNDGYSLVVMRNSSDLVSVTLYEYTGGSWSEKIIFTSAINSSATNTVNMNRDGSRIVIYVLYNAYEYSNNTLSPISVNVAQSAVFSRTNADWYAYTNGNKVYSPLISLDVTVNINPNNFLLSFGSNIIAACDSVQTGNKAIVFLDMYDPTTTCTAATSIEHGYPYDYEVQITGTNSFNGTWLITAVSSNTFTFEAFGGPTETTGYVSGTTTGISGGGGYTGSAGDSVSGATCYADPSVRNFTDIGASSNHMGYVTVSLIDPAPIDLTLWSWDDESPWDNLDSFQSNVYTITWSESLGIFVTSGIQAGVCISSNDAKKWYNRTIPWPYSTSPLVAADDKPIIVLGMNTSNDGITWYLNDLPYTVYYYTDVTNAVYVNKMFISTAAPGYYTPYSGMYTSTDGYAWTFISSELISVKAYGSSMYVGTTNAQSNPNIPEQVVYSTDLVTWNYTSIYVYDLIFANGIFIGFNDDGSVISSDGISWTLYPYSFAFSWSYYPPPIRQIIFGNDLFMVVTARHVYTSPDGMNWTLTKIFSQNIDVNISVTYSPSKQFFMFAPSAGVPVATLEGKYFTSLSEQIKYPVKGCAYSKPLNVLVVLARSYSYSGSDDPIYIYTSSDNGETLLETSILYFGYQQPLQFEIDILWSDELYSFFIYFATSNNGLLIFTSSDGMTWTRQNDYIPNISIYNLQGFKPVWYKEKNLFEYSSSYSFTFYSPDGINWSYHPTTEPSPPDYIGSKAWSPELELFVGTSKLNGVSSSFDVYVSTDGINWSTVYTAFMSTVAFVGVVWSPELKKFYIYAAGYPTEADSLYLFESPDGYVWNKRVVPKVYTLDYASGFYWFSGFDRFVVQSFENFKGITFSTKAVKQF